MLILSTFNSDYLQHPAPKYPQTFLLKSLFEKFTTESIEIKYVNKNLIGELIGLKTENLKSCAILFRLFDFLEADSIIVLAKLEEHLSLILKQIILIKQKSVLPFVVFLCPSPEVIYNEELKKIEEKYIEELNKNKIHVLTLSNIKELYSIKSFENSIEGETHIPYLPEFYSAMACLLARKLHAIMQKDFKLIAVDCDNTLWTGVAAEDGSEGVVFEEHNLLLQEYLVKQHANGKIICLCSKNDEQTVIDVFNRHEAEMPLKIKHLSKYNKINWKPKSENIKELAKELNLFPDSFLFIDDNPIEINEVSQNLNIFCITMPQNLKEYKNHWGFDIDEHLIITETDKNRDALYSQAEIKAALATQFKDPVEYLRSPELGQSIIVNKLDSEEDMQTIQRVSQLSGKTNQFNTFPESKSIEINEIKSIINSATRDIFIGKIKDIFSSEDITAVAVTTLNNNSLTINRFFLSCRVFNRGMEYEMLKHIARFALEEGKKYININYKKSIKNIPASNFLNILSEEENPKSKLLFDKIKDNKLLHASLKFLLKKLDLYLDFRSLELDENAFLRLSARKVASIDLDGIIRKALNFSQQPLIQNKLTLGSKLTEKYLIELKQMTSSLEDLSNQFFIDNQIIKSITTLETRINTLCNQLLGDEAQDKSLVARGLDSLKATEMRLSLYETEKIMITIQMLLCEKITSVTLADYIKQQEKASGAVAQNDNVYNKFLPVSFQQQRIWLAEQQESAGNSSNYHMTACYKLTENLDIQHLEAACHELMRLYDAFGTIFLEHNHELKQFLLFPKSRELYFKIKNLQREEDLEEAIKEETNVAWSMTDKPLIRFTVFKEQAKKNYYIFFHIHHAIFDAISLKNCLDTLSTLYQKSLSSNALVLRETPPQYSEFVRNQLKKHEDKIYQKEAYSFWEKTLSKIETVTLLPNDQSTLPKPATEQIANRYAFTLSHSDLLALKSLAQSHATTCFNVLNGLFAFLVASYTYQDKITLIVATNGRDGHPTFNKMIGFFVNLIVQQFDFEKDQNFDTFLTETHRKFLASQEFQEVHFWKIQEILQKQGIKNILSSPAFIYQSYSIPELKLDQQVAELILPKQPIIFDRRETCRFGDFTLFAQENNKELNFVIEYAQAVFSPDFIERFANNFKHIISQVSHKPIHKLQDISVVCDAEKDLLIHLGSGPKQILPKEPSLISKFKETVNNFPENIALCYRDQHLSYEELDQQSTNLAHALSNAGAKFGDNVGIFLNGAQFYIAVLAIRKIFAVIVPFNKNSDESKPNERVYDPEQRLQYIIENAKIKFFIVDDNPPNLVKNNFQADQLISINAIYQSVDRNKELPIPSQNTETFCVLYTSGSTGNPKGVVLLEKGVFRVVESPNFIKVSPEDKIAQTANQAFDAAQLECWLAWNHGASLVVFDKRTILDNILLRSKLVEENITHMWLTAGLFNSLANNQPDLFKNLKYLMVGGDVVHKEAILKVLNLDPSPSIINGYGPTEASIFALTHTFDKRTINNHNTTLIGSPINETEVEIVTLLGAKTPLGGIGELIIKGPGVAAGYLNSPKLQNRFKGNPENRSYQTGDLVKYSLIDRQIMFMSRADTQQVKINGNLVAIEEVRSCLSRNKYINQVEIVVKNVTGTNQLIAVYTLKDLNEKFNESIIKEFRDYLNDQLPAYMHPSFYVQIESFINMTNANGKLDNTKLKKFILKLDVNLLEELPPKTENGSKLLELIKERLPGFPNNVKANIFEYGCDSIVAMEIINQINKTFSKEFIQRLKLEFEKDTKNKFNNNFVNDLNEKVFHTKDLYQNPTIDELEDLLTKKLLNNTKRSSLRILKNGNSNLPPVIFIHPAGGGLSCFSKLIDHIEFDNVCYGIEDPLLECNQLKLLTMENMAENYLTIINTEINGPFILVGYSFGGMLALEIAALHESTSENPYHLKGCILIDTWVVSCLSETKQIGLKNEVLLHCADQRKKTNISDNSSEILEALGKLCEHHQEIGFNYKPRKLSSTPVYLLKATILNAKFKEMHNQDENNFLLKFLDKKLIDSEKVCATHYDILENVEKNFLTKLFSNKVNEISEKKSIKVCRKPSLVEQSKFFTTPLNEVADPNTFCSLLYPKVK